MYVALVSASALLTCGANVSQGSSAKTVAYLAHDTASAGRFLQATDNEIAAKQAELAQEARAALEQLATGKPAPSPPQWTQVPEQHPEKVQVVQPTQRVNAPNSVSNTLPVSTTLLINSTTFHWHHRLRRHVHQAVSLHFSDFLVNPLKILKELFTLAVLVIVCIVLWKRRSDVLILLTGEDRVHATPMDAVWWTCFRCCGVCSHEWTRCLSYLPCCPAKLHGANLMRVFGSELGLVTHTVDLSNLVVGDLPVHGRRADYYLSFECSHNPPIRTSVAEGKIPKVVHFPEVVTLRMRNNKLESSLVITAYKLDLVGSVELCSVKLKASNIINWSKDADEKKRRKRFAMREPREDLLNAEDIKTPPWIAFELSTPATDPRHDPRLLDRFATRNMVRTSMMGTNRDLTVAETKEEYELLDTMGHIVQEPPEEDLAKLECYRDLVVVLFRFCSFFSSFLIIALIVGRSYLQLCENQWRRITIAAKLRPKDAPFSVRTLVNIERKCMEMTEGTGAMEGDHPCRPSMEQIIRTCDHPPANQPTPYAFGAIGQKIFNDGERHNLGFVCSRNVCDLHDSLHAWDNTLLVVGCLLLFYVCCLLRPCANTMIEQQKLKAAKEHRAKRTNVHARELEQQQLYRLQQPMQRGQYGYANVQPQTSPYARGW